MCVQFRLRNGLRALGLCAGSTCCAGTSPAVYFHHKITALQKEKGVTGRRVYGLVHLPGRAIHLPTNGPITYCFSYAVRLSGMFAAESGLCVPWKKYSNGRRFVVASCCSIRVSLLQNSVVVGQTAISRLWRCAFLMPFLFLSAHFFFYNLIIGE